MIRPSILLLLVLSLLAVIGARVVVEEDQLFNANQVAAVLKPILENVRQGRAQSTSTLTVLKTTTLSSVTTTTITTKKTCGVLASVVSGTVGGISTFSTSPAVTCRRKRQFWHEPMYVALKDDHDDLGLQYYRLSPSQVLNFEPTLLPQFRNTNRNPSVELVKESPMGLEASFERQPIVPHHLRVDSRLFPGSLSSIISSIVSNILVSTTTTTTTSTAYTSTSTSTSYSSTATYYVVGSCYPSGLSVC